MQRFKLAALTVILLLAGAMTPVHAATIFTDSGTFETATGGSTLLDDYNDFTTFTALPTVTDRGDYQIVELSGSTAGIAGTGIQNIDGTGHFSMGANSIFGSEARFEFDMPVTALAFEYRTDAASNELVIQSGSFSTSIFAGQTAQFFGVIFDAPVTFVDISNIGIRSTAMDNLRTVAVPEPTSMSLAMVGIGTLLLRRQRRARTRRA